MTVISLAERKQQKQSEETHCDTLVGMVRCLSCKHEWQAEAPAGSTWLECPECSLMKGRFIYPVERKDPHWVCGCGNSYFQMNPDGIYCPNCGSFQTGF